jgi:pyridoxamine 5'-phosphate oxidase family protein
MTLDEAHVRYLESHARGRLATVGPDGAPQNKPVGYRYHRRLGTIDIAGMGMQGSAKYRNIAANPEVAFVVDDAVGEGPEGVRFVELRGRAEQAVDDRGHIIRIHPRRVVSWNVHAGRPGMFAADLLRRGETPERPVLGLPAGSAERAVARLVEELQRGLDARDADVYNRSFAADVLWGSPYGATVTGYTELHAIHERLLAQAAAGPRSRYELVRTLVPANGVALAQVRRVALEPDGRPAQDGFSEMALYVLVRRGGTWWLAAGQNTPIAS